MNKYKIWYIITDYGDSDIKSEFFPDSESVELATRNNINQGGTIILGPKYFEIITNGSDLSPFIAMYGLVKLPNVAANNFQVIDKDMIDEL